MEETPSWESIGVAGAMIREYEKDQIAFFEMLGSLLAKSFGPSVRLIESGGFLKKKRLEAIELPVEDWLYHLRRDERGALEAGRKHVVRGIALKTESMSVAQWLVAIQSLIQERMRHSEAAARAIAEVLGL